MTHPGSRCRAGLWFVLPAVSSEGTLNSGPVLPSDGQIEDVAPIGDDTRDTRASQRVSYIPWFLVDVLHVKATELKRTGVLQGLSE
jgi:hypothetical protein